MINFVELLKQIVTPLVINTNDVNIVVKKEEDNEINLALFVSSNDLGRVIGKAGRTANAIRNILYAAGSLEHKKVTLDIDSSANNK